MFERLKENAFGLLMSLFIIGPILAVALPVPQKPTRPQQLVYESQTSLANGERAGIFVPANAVALGLQSKSGSRVLTIGEILHCRPFVEPAEVFRKTATGAIEASAVSQEFLNCGPPAPGEPDRILAIVGIQWRE